MLQADTEKKAAEEVSVDVEFDTSVQSLDALQAAAYRLIGIATCEIKRNDGHFVCHLTTQSAKSRDGSHIGGAVTLKSHFLDLVTDENLRARLAQKTERMRNVILALAFGALANSEEK